MREQEIKRITCAEMCKAMGQKPHSWPGIKELIVVRKRSRFYTICVRDNGELIADSDRKLTPLQVQRLGLEVA